MSKARAIIKTEEEIELMRESSRIVSMVLGELSNYMVPGISTLRLDEIAYTFIKDHHAEPAFLNYKPHSSKTPYPYTLCVSVNEYVVHGLPKKDVILKEGDIVSIDCGVKYQGYYGDSAYSFKVGEVKPEVQKLLDVTYECLELGIKKAVHGNRVGDIGYEVQTHAEKYGYGVVRDLVGHGIGTSLHEAPEVPNYGSRGKGMMLVEGLTIAIEPMINMGTKRLVLDKDGWSLSTADKLPSAHFEHTVVVRKGKAEILTTFEYIKNGKTAVV
jgi:methionyl aminopeptidase